MILVETSLIWEVFDMPKDLNFFKTPSRIIVSKLKELFSLQKWLLYFCNIKVLGSSPTTGSIPLAKSVS